MYPSPGCVSTLTGRPLAFAMQAEVGASAISPLSTLLKAMTKSMAHGEAAAKVALALGLPIAVELETYDVFADLQRSECLEPACAKILEVNTQLASLIVVGDALFFQTNYTAAAADIAAAAGTAGAAAAVAGRRLAEAEAEAGGGESAPVLEGLQTDPLYTFSMADSLAAAVIKAATTDDKAVSLIDGDSVLAILRCFSPPDRGVYRGVYREVYRGVSMGSIYGH